MRDLTKMLLLLAIGIIGGMLLFKFSCAPDTNLDELRREIEEVRRQNEALEAANRLAFARIDSLRLVDAINKARADSLRKEIRDRTKVITKIVRDLNVYKGTPTDLLRELNLFIRSPLPPLPDTSDAR